MLRWDYNLHGILNLLTFVSALFVIVYTALNIQKQRMALTVLMAIIGFAFIALPSSMGNGIETLFGEDAQMTAATEGITQIDGGENIGQPVALQPLPEAPKPQIDQGSALTPAFTSTTTQPISTFAADVDTASYTLVKRMIQSGLLPPPDAVRVEEFVNAFDYHYPLPSSKDQPFKPTIAVYPAPNDKSHLILHIGIKGYDIARETRPPANLVFLVDTSGSMQGGDRLPLVQQSLRLLVEQLNGGDRVSIVTYAGSAGVVLAPTTADEKATILSAIDRLSAGGSTAGAEGIKTAYDLAKQSFRDGGVNRVMLFTDGDFNVGINDPKALGDYVDGQRKSGVFLSVFGYGMGNYNDKIMQSLAQRGNGVAAYIGNEADARHMLIDGLTANLFTIAKDVKFQIEFNPDVVSAYRQIGYETRALKTEDFNNDAFDAGDIGAGHTVTALYELIPAKSGVSDAFGQLKIRFKQADSNNSQLIERPIVQADMNVTALPAEIQMDITFAAHVAAFAEWLRGDRTTIFGLMPKDYLDFLAEMRRTGVLTYNDQNRAEFSALVEQAIQIKGQ